MLFTFLVAAAACQSFALRPEHGRAVLTRDVSKVSDLVSSLKSSNPKESLMALKTATGIMDSILMQAGNATDHLSDDDAKLLRSVIELVETSIYGSMDSSHGADESALGMAISQIEQCNADLTHRLGADGDLGALHKSVSEKQAELNRLRGEMDSANATRESEWERFSTHMTMIREPESCPALPSRTMPALDVFFEKSEYSVWFAAAQAEYVAHRDAFVAADDALKAAVQAYNLQKARRDTQYCDWKRELEQSCENFETCFRERSRYYTDELTPRVQSDMASRIEAFKSGETLVQQVKFLLGDSPTRETPAVDTSRFVVNFPALPDKGECDLSPLDSAEWVPTPDCHAEPTPTPWVWSARSESCLTKCSSSGRVCDTAVQSAMTTDELTSKVQEMLGVTCTSTIVGTWAGNPCMWVPGKRCYTSPSHNPSRCDISAGGERRLCYCREA